MRKALCGFLWFLLFACGPEQPFILVNVTAPPGTIPPAVDTLEVTASAVVDDVSVQKTLFFSTEGQTLPLSFSLSFPPDQRGLDVQISLKGLLDGQDVFSGEVSAKVGKDEVDLIAQFCGDANTQELRAEYRAS